MDSIHAPTAAAPIPGVLDEQERVAVERWFGVVEEQVVRDHAISHTLAAIARIGADDVVFYSGTALPRTHLPGLRLSERYRPHRSCKPPYGRRPDRAGDHSAITPHAGFREVRPAYSGHQTSRPGGHAGRRRQHPDPIGVVEGYPDWPTEIVEIEQRYSDAPPATPRVLTSGAFVASKLSSWSDRGASRDLYDLWALAEAGMIDAEAAALFAKLGPHTSASKVPFTRIPTDAQWRAALDHQCTPAVGPEAAARIVSEALAATSR
jgi:hypothetical protein